MIRCLPRHISLIAGCEEVMRLKDRKYVRIKECNPGGKRCRG